MQRMMRGLAVALLAVIVGGVALAPSAEARHFHGGFGFGYGHGHGFGYAGGYGYGYRPFYGAAFYGLPPIYYTPRVAYIPPPPVYGYYSYGYHHRRVHRAYHRVVHRSWCRCHCCP
jgi:hypothetical protein